MTKLRAWMLMTGVGGEEFGAAVANAMGRRTPYKPVTVLTWASARGKSRPSLEAAIAIECLTGGFVSATEAREANVYQMKFAAWAEGEYKPRSTPPQESHVTH